MSGIGDGLFTLITGKKKFFTRGAFGDESGNEDQATREQLRVDRSKNLGKFLHPKGDETEPVDNASEEASEPGVGSKLAGRLRPGMFKLKPKTAQQQSDADKKAESENAQNATRASVIGTRG